MPLGFSSTSLSSHGEKGLQQGPLIKHRGNLQFVSRSEAPVSLIGAQSYLNRTVFFLSWSEQVKGSTQEGCLGTFKSLKVKKMKRVNVRCTVLVCVKEEK